MGIIVFPTQETCLKNETYTEKVSFNNTSEASYVETRVHKNCQNLSVWASFENLINESNATF